MPESVTILESRIQRAIAPDFRDRLLGKGLARGVIWRDGALPPESPSFPRTLTEDLLDFGHTVLAMALRLRGVSPDSPHLKQAFLCAGEAIESAVHQGEPGRPDSGFHRVIAAVAFHLARYAARAYSILPDGTIETNTSPSELALARLLRRSLDELHEQLSTWLLDEVHRDAAVAERLQTDADYNEYDAIDDILTTSLMRGLALFDHALRTGTTASANRAKQLLLTGAAAAADLHVVPHWWILTLAAHLIDELWDHSLHERLPKLPPDHPDERWNGLRRDYIHRLRRNSRAAIELWPSQITAAERAIDPADDLIIALPTSAGKTRIAELCILRALAAGKRVVYVTPLRALSAQVERDLSDTFVPLGFPVSSLYGSAGVEAADADTLRTKEIVVSTPEKLDFALRNDPTIIDDVGLIVLDEGHMLGPGEREVRYEALVQSLLRRDDAGDRRIVCLSALFPETEKMTDLVAWIRRDRPGEPVHSEWRPTRQRFGWIQWEGRAARLQVRVEEEESYVPRFVKAKHPPSGSRRRNTFPQKKNELTLATAWQFAGHGKDVMIYCARRDSVESLGKLILKCGRQGVLSRLGDVTPRIREVMATGKEWLGPNHPAVRCLEYGVALHHGGLPRQFLSEVERLLRSGDCRVTIASPTLAQGLNLSASVLLVPSIWRTREEKISPVEFANVAGRAGRAFVDLEGLVLHVVWKRDQEKRRWVIQQWEELVAQARASEIESGLLRLTALLFERIERAAGVSIEEVIEYVTGHGEAWDYTELVGERTEVSESEWERDVASLDAAILGLLDVETAIDEIERQLDVVLDGSLFTRQIARLEARIQDLIRRFLAARARLIWSRTTTAQRRGYQVAGLGLRGGRFLDEHMEELVGALLAAETMIDGSDETSAADAIVQFAGLVFQTVPFRPTKMPDAWRDALHAWISGRPAAEVVDIGGEEGVDFLQDAVMYRLAWAMEAVRVHATTIGHDGADNIRGLAAMAVEAGSANPSVITLLRSGLNSRDVAKAAVESTGANFVDRTGMLGWLESDEVQTRSREEDWPTPEGRSTWLRFIETIRQGNRVRWSRSRQTVDVDWLDPASPPEPGSHVIVETTTDPQGGGWVLQPDFTPLGRLRSPLERPREDIVDARVGRQPSTVRIEFFGPRGVR